MRGNKNGIWARIRRVDGGYSLTCITSDQCRDQVEVKFMQGVNVGACSNCQVSPSRSLCRVRLAAHVLAHSNLPTKCGVCIRQRSFWVHFPIARQNCLQHKTRVWFLAIRVDYCASPVSRLFYGQFQVIFTL